MMTIALVALQVAFAGSFTARVGIAPPVIDPLDPSEYTTITGASPGAITKTSSGGNLVLGMANDVGAGKVLFRPSTNLIASGGKHTQNTPIRVAMKIIDHSGWDGTAAFLGVGLGVVGGSGQLDSLQLQSRNSATEEYGHHLYKTDGFTTTSSTGWTSGWNDWGENAITPKTTPIYLGITYDPAGTNAMRVWRGNPGTETWTSVHIAPTFSLVANVTGNDFGIYLHSHTGTQAFEVVIGEIEWEWDGSSWPFATLAVQAPASESLQTQYPDIPSEWLVAEDDSTGFPVPARRVQ